MSVIPFPNLEPQGASVFAEWGLDSITGESQSPTSGHRRTKARPGSAFRTRLRYENLTGANAEIMARFLAECDGHANRFYVPIYGHTRRGSGIGTELYSNGDFSSGVTGWAVQSSAALTAPDRAGRLTLTGNALGTPAIYQSITLTAYLPYAIRSVLHDGAGSSGLLAGRFIDGGAASIADYLTTRGLGVVSLVSDASGAQSNYPMVASGSSDWRAGDFIECSLASMTRCALIDDGPNALTRSDEFDHADWSKVRATVTANSDTAPDGSATADTLREDGTAANDHRVSQGVTVAATADTDLTFGVFLKADQRTWAQVDIIENTGAHRARANINLSTGALGTVASTGANMADPRAKVVDAGDGWYFVSVTARKTNAATSVSARIFAAEADDDVVFNGLTQDSVLMWRATFAEGSGVPTRPVQTVASADADGASQTGRALHLKGLPVSTDGILLSGDYAQVITPNGQQIVKVTAALNSDAAGLGYLQFTPELKESPADNAPVIDFNPLCRMMLDANSVRWRYHAPGRTSLEFSAIEDVTG